MFWWVVLWHFTETVKVGTQICSLATLSEKKNENRNLDVNLLNTLDGLFYIQITSTNYSLRNHKL